MDNKAGRLSKALTASLLILVFLAQATAPFSDQEGPLAQPTGIEIIDSINSFLLYEITGFPQLAIFFAIWYGFYAATRPLLNKIFSEMLEVFPNLGEDRRYSSRGNTQEVVDKSVKGLSAAAAFVAAQYVGWLIGGFALVAIALLSLLLPLLLYLVGAGRFVGAGLPGALNAASDMIPGYGEDPRTDGGAATDTGGDPGSGPEPGSERVPEEYEERINDIEDQIEAIADQISDLDATETEIEERFRELRDKIGTVEDETGQVSEELSQLAGEVENLEQFRDRINQFVNQGKLTQDQAKRVEELIDESEALENLEELIEEHNERILQNEENIEGNEEEILRIEEKIEELEKQMLNEMRELASQVHQKLNKQQGLSQRIDDLTARVSRGEEDINRFSEEIGSLWGATEDLRDETGQNSERIAALRNQMSELDMWINSVEEQISKEDFDSRFAELEEMINQTRAEESRGEKIEKDEAKKASGFPSELKEVFKNDIGLEREILREEEAETGQEIEILKEEDYVEKLEEKLIKGEDQVESEMEQDLIAIGQLNQALEVFVQKDMEKLKALEREEREKYAVTEENITKINGQLTRIMKGESDLSKREIEDVVREYLKELEYLREHSQDSEHIGEIRQAYSLAKKILEQENYVARAEKETEREAEQLALEAQEVAAALPESPAANVFAEAETELETAMVILEEDLTKPGVKNWNTEMIGRWIGDRVDPIIKDLEDLRRKQGPSEISEEAKRIENGLIDVVDKICEERNVEKSYFPFLN